MPLGGVALGRIRGESLVGGHESYIGEKSIFGLRINRRQNGSTFKHFDAVGPDATDFGEIMQNNGHDSESPSLVPMETPYAISC